jgi:hypothetical protein
MKNLFIISGVILLMLSILVIHACRKDKPTPPTLTTSAVTEISYTTATSGGEVTDAGSASLVSSGVCWGTTANPAISNSKTSESGGLGAFTSNITQLTPGTLYYVRAYATNSAGTGYGNQESFATHAVEVPVLTTTEVTDITIITAASGGNITDDKGSSVTARGVCWSTSENPTTSDRKTTDGSGIGSFTSNITGLNAGMTYYVRAYATNSAGSVYGDQRSFTTLESAVTKGYYLLQGVGTYYSSMFGAISTVAEADSICSILNSHSVSGVEFGPIYFHPTDITATILVANVFLSHGIDLWLNSGGLQKNIHAFNNDQFPDQYRAYSMTSDGSIVPATIYSLGSSEKVTAFDAMNPEAVSWFLDRYMQIYLKPLAPYTSGYFFDEDCLYYANDPDRSNNIRIDYWELPAYSDAVLSFWQEYCVNNSVTFNSMVVTKFPVHDESMVPNGGGKTQYFPGYNVPPSVEGGTAVISIPPNTGVWAAWDDFVTTQYTNTWIGGISEAVYQANFDNPNFKGVLYFGHHAWSLGYEEVTDPTFVIDTYHKWVPWGTQRGVRLSKICELPYVDHIICETYPPIHANLNKYLSTYKQIISDHNKTFGLMLHRDDSWGLDGEDLESDRWAAIQYFQPTIIARYPINRLFPTDMYYNEDKEALFDHRLHDYR